MKKTPLSRKDCPLCFGTGKRVDSAAVNKAIEKSGIAQRSIAAELEVSEAYISKLLSGQREWTHELVDRLKRILAPA